MGFQKRGEGSILPEAGQKTATTKEWSEQDQQALDEENVQADGQGE